MRTSRFERHPELLVPPSITERVLQILGALDRHGALSTQYLLKLVAPSLKDKADFSDTLQALFHHGYVARPPTLNHPHLWGTQLVYRLDDKGRHVLSSHSRLSPFKTPPSNDPTHDYLTSCITASIEIAVNKAGYRFLSASDILSRIECPESTRFPRKNGTKALTPFDIPASIRRQFRYEGNEYNWNVEKPITPDALFGIQYNDGEAFFALEADRNSEDGFSSHPLKNSLVSKIMRYQDVMVSRTFMSHFGISNLMVLFVTMPESRVELIGKLVRHFLKLPQRIGGGPGASYIAATSIPFFGEYYTPPILSELFEKPWQRFGTEPFSLKG